MVKVKVPSEGSHVSDLLNRFESSSRQSQISSSVVLMVSDMYTSIRRFLFIS